MSLKAFEQAWIEYLLTPSKRSWHSLSEPERASLESQPPQILTQWRSETQQRRLKLLNSAFPLRVRQLLGESQSERLINQLLTRPGLPPAYPRQELIAYMLQTLMASISREASTPAHLRDLLNYELAASRLQFFAKPQADPQLKGPRLAHWARLIRLGENFSTVLESLSQGYPVIDLPETPTRRFLLTQDWRGLQLEMLPAALVSWLDACDGTQTWAELPDSTEPGMASWLEQLIKRGVLISPSA